jgi:hypothetical protein
MLIRADVAVPVFLNWAISPANHAPAVVAGVQFAAVYQSLEAPAFVHSLTIIIVFSFLTIQNEIAVFFDAVLSVLLQHCFAY